MLTYLIDDDGGARSSLASSFQAAGLELRPFAGPGEFLVNYVVGVAGCLILDLRLQGVDGLEFLRELRASGRCFAPVMFLTACGTVHTAVRAMKLGARDFIEKPADPEELIVKVRGALADDRARIDREWDDAQLDGRFDELTGRERELVPLICSGLSNKQIAARLELSIKTVVNHRAHILSKVQAANTADLVRLATSRGLAHAAAA